MSELVAAENQAVLLTEFESKEFLRKGGIPVVPTRLARSRTEAIALGQKIGFPIAMKIASPDIAHKSDVGGVKLRLENATQVGKAYDAIMAAVSKNAASARVDGVTVQKMARPGVEVILGVSQDPQFGPVILFGLGGVLVEILQDVSLRLVPVTLSDAEEMIHEIKGYKLLEGYRGQEAADIPALAKLIVQVSQLVEQNPQIQELDLNPVFAYHDGAVAGDARIVIMPE